MKYEMWDKLNNYEAYKLSSCLADKVWAVVESWDYLVRKGLGIQYTNSADSIAANISEGFGRYHYKDKIKFYYYSRGSLLEAYYWTQKAYKRRLLDEDQYRSIMKYIRKIPIEINILINNTRAQIKK